MKPKLKIQTVIFVFLMLLFLASAGCTLSPAAVVNPQDTTSDLSKLNMPDGSTIVVNGSAEFGVSRLANLASSLNYQGWVASGEVLVVSQLPTGTWYTIVNPSGFIARVTASNSAPGAIMLVKFDPATGTFTINCILGICQMGQDPENLSNIPLNNQGSLNQGGTFQGTSASAGALITATYGSYITGGSPVATYTSIPAASTITTTATSIPSATRTSPPNQPTAVNTNTPVPNLAATATAACSSFQSQFPGTPCP